MFGSSITLQSISGLAPADEEKLKKAKMYALEQTMKFAQSQQMPNQSNQMAALADAAQRQRAILLMSRIYIGSIYYELGEDILRQAFCPFGNIRSVNLSWDALTMKHKGYAFVEYETVDAAQMALEQMNGALLAGRPIKVGRPNNVPQAAPIFAKMNEEARDYNRIYVSSIHLDLTEAEIKSVFEAFGHVRSIQLAPDVNPTKHRGWGYVEYTNQRSCEEAIKSMNLFDLGGQFIRVGRALTPPLPLLPPNSTIPLTASTMFGAFDGGMMGMSDVIQFGSFIGNTMNPGAMAPSMPGVPESSLQQEENVSISGSNARLVVMQKLSRKSDSKILILRNMVGPNDIDAELEDEVNTECSKYGKVVRVIVYQEKQEDDSVTVKIFVLFSLPKEAERAAELLNGRYFAGRVVKAETYDEVRFSNNDLSG